MKFRIHFVNGQYADFAWQQRIGSPEDRPTIHRAYRVNVFNLSMCMNTRVGPARTIDVHFMIEQLLKNFLEFALNGSDIRLNLPSVKVGTIIGESQLEVPHPIGYSM